MGKKHKKHYRDDRDGDDSGPENPDSPQPQKARKYRSELWNYFEETPSGAAKCQLCGEIVFRNKGSTCNMLGHMRKLHSENKFSSSRKVKLKPEDMGETKQLLQLDRLEKQMAIVYADTTGKYRPVLDDEKSLRVVLKLTPQEQITKAMSIKEETVYDEFGEIKRHKHKKKKKKHKHDKERKERKRMHDEIDDDEGSINEDGYDSFIESNPKKALFDSSCGSDVPPINKNVTQSEKIRSLEKCLLYIQLHIQRKDINGFFAFPVSDEIAPGYSSIIDIPMDFSLMKAKIEKGLYSSIAEYRNDFILMCENCMTYNRRDTIYHKEAKRLLQAGIKAMDREKLILMRKNLPFMANLTDEDLGLDNDDDMIHVESLGSPTGIEAPIPYVPVYDSPIARPQKARSLKPKSGAFEPPPCDMSEQQILAQAAAAAQDAANELNFQKPLSKMGYLRQKENAITTFNFLNPDNNGFVSDIERVVDLGTLVGKLNTGSGSMAGFREDKRNKATPAMYMNYGPFSSHGPVYDTSFSTMSKDESDVLLSTYGDETGVQVAKSLMSFVEDCSDYTIKMVDNLLDIMTGGQHSKTAEIIKEREELEKDKEEMSVPDNSCENEDLSLPDMPSVVSNLINSQNLNNFSEKSDEEIAQINKQLKESSENLANLERIQYNRLSHKPATHLANISSPSNEESNLASKLTQQLASLAKQVQPGHLIKSDTLHSAMRVNLKRNEEVEESSTNIQSEETNELEEFKAFLALPSIKSPQVIHIDSPAENC